MELLKPFVHAAPFWNDPCTVMTIGYNAVECLQHCQVVREVQFLGTDGMHTVGSISSSMPFVSDHLVASLQSDSLL